MLRSEQTTVTWQQRQYQPAFFDFNQDNIDDLLLQAISAEDRSLLVLGHHSSTDEKFVPQNSQILPALIAGSGWSAADAQLLPLRRSSDGGTGLLVIFPQRQAAVLFAFHGQNLNLSQPIAKYTAAQWPFLKAVAAHKLHTADFDHDGVDEILQLGKVSGEHQILKLQANFSFSTQQKIQKKVAWGLQDQARIIVGDFDNNGFADIFALAKKADSKHYLVMADQHGKFSDVEVQEISPEIGGLPWLDESSGTMLVRRRDDQRANLLRFYNADELGNATNQSCIGWLYDPKLKTSQEYCLKSASSGDGRASKQIFQNPPLSVVNPLTQLDVDSNPECPIVPYSTGGLLSTALQLSNECEYMPIKPFSAPRMDASSFAVNQNFNVHLDSTGDPRALTYEVWAISGSNLFYSVATVIAPGATHTLPTTTVSGRLSIAGDYLVRYRSCNDNGCSGFGPAGFLNIYAAPVTHLVSTNAGAGGSVSPSSRSVVQGSSTSFTVTANSGYTINGVSGCGGSLSGTTFTT
ncbi:VCBS repeat-containing protein, partial [Rheinheimera riviphila]